MILCQTDLSRSVCIVWYFVLDMKYMCKTCQKPCNDIIEHVKKVHGFSESYIKDQLKTNSNSYKNAFEKIKWLRKNPMDIILVERLNRKDVKRINQNKYIFYIYSIYVFTINIYYIYLKKSCFIIRRSNRTNSSYP